MRLPETSDVGCTPSAGRPDYGQVMGALSVVKGWTLALGIML